jgi:hypothetical protein
MATIGLLPASGRASRLGGIPKFCLPISDDGRTLLHWHVERMLEVCDEVRVSTRPEWVSLVSQYDLPVKLMSRNPSTMTDAVRYMASGGDDRLVIGMPDTIVVGATVNPYAQMVAVSDGTAATVVLAAFACPTALRGHVGQLELDNNDNVLAAEDKAAGCQFSHMWGAMLWDHPIELLDPEEAHPGLLLPGIIAAGLHVRAARCPGEYVDLGRMAGVTKYYSSL